MFWSKIKLGGLMNMSYLVLNKERISYDQLNITQWVAGFGQTMREESDPNLRIFPGPQPRPATPFCCVGWDKERSKIFLMFLL